MQMKKIDARSGSARVLLVNPPMVVDAPPMFPSFGIGYVAMALKEHGCEVEILDIDAHRFERDEVSRRLQAAAPDLIGIGGLASVYPYLKWLVPEIRRFYPAINIVLGGAVASSLKEKCFETLDIDFAVIGEGEITIVELLEAIAGERGLSEVKGIAGRQNGDVVFAEPRPLMPSLDEVPILDHSLFPMDVLLKNSNGIAQVHTQRGCPYSCTFCFNCYRVVSNKVRYRPVENVLDEIGHLRQQYPIELYAISGECVTAKKSWLQAFCSGLTERGLDIPYRVTSRVDSIDEERLSWLRDSGCASISFGLESGSDRILQIMDKRTTAAQGVKAVQLAKNYIPNIETSIILGYLGENQESLDETVDFCIELGVLPLFFHATPFPGTVLYDTAIKDGRIADEEAYLDALDQSSISRGMGLNLTDMPGAVAEKALEDTIRRVHDHYFMSGAFDGSNPLKKLVTSMKRDGLPATAAKIGRASRVALGKLLRRR